MGKYQTFEELPVWREAAKLYNRVLDLLEESNLPLSSGFRNQLDRAALSVSNNVAEGFERLTTNELISFLAIAKGSGERFDPCWRWSRTGPGSGPLSEDCEKYNNWQSPVAGN